MADLVVVLDSSDDDDDIQKTEKISLKNMVKRVLPQNNKKRKMQQIDDEISSSKRMYTTYQEDLTTVRNFSDHRLGSAPLLPLETLATPSATPPLQLLASPPRNINSVREIDKSPCEVILDSPKSTEKTVRRVKFTTILKESDDAWQQLRHKRLSSTTSVQSPQPSTPTPTPSETAFADSIVPDVMDLTSPSASKAVSSEVTVESTTTTGTKDKRAPLGEKPPLEKEYEELISECRKADPSPDMEKLIETKLLKYYYSVHPDFVKSRGFRKTVCSTIERIRSEPELVYYNLKTVVDELNVRRKSKDVVITNDETTPTTGSANKHTEEQIKKLNKALYILKKRIARLEESEVDWEDEDSAYLQVERFKKRACQIYEKICDLTGESKNARRLVKKPIQFSGTSYPAFNKTLQAYINRTKEFPDYFDVLRMLEHCNRQYDLKLASFEVKRIAQDAFIKVGKTLQSRRKTDLYETVAHFTANSTDPATADPTLLAKLKENEKTRTKISEVIEKFARVQDDPEAAAKLKHNKIENKIAEKIGENGQVDPDKQEDGLPSDDSDDNEDDEDDENLDVHVEKLTQENTMDVSDVESDPEVNDESRTETEETIEKSKESKESCSTKENDIEEKKLEDNEVELTENNNIMRTKANGANVFVEETNCINIKTQTSMTKSEGNDKTITALPEKLQSTNKNQPGTVKEVTAKTLKITQNTNQKTSLHPEKHRTVAEIVISDEE